MKNFLFTFFAISIFFKTSAQYPKIIVQLRDKGNNTFSIGNPSQYLSQRAIQRRVRYNIAIDSADLPVTESYLDSIQSAGNVSILSKSKWLNQVLINTMDQNAITKIMSFPFVKSASGVGYRKMDNNHNDKFKETLLPINITVANRSTGIDTNVYNYGNSYNQVHIHQGEFLHNKGFHGETIQIAVLDAGFFQYKTVTAFDSIRINGQVLGERDFVTFDNGVNEDDAHGMYCLSILSANWPDKMIGTAPKAGYWLIRTENTASEYPIEEHNWVAGAEFADSAGADIITSSVGYNKFDDPSFDHSYTDFYKNTTMISRGAATGVSKGMIVTNSAGNEGNNSWKYLIFPSDDDSVCAVGAVNAEGVIANFSSYGYPGKVKPNIVSVGEGTVIAGLNNEPASGNGTSFSNPNIAGLIACLWQAFPNVNNMKILDAVYKSADRFTAPTNQYGYGIPDFKTAYHLLKHDENVHLYGNEWLFASPDPFTNKIDTKFIGRVDGSATLELINAFGQIIASQNFTTEKEEVYNYTFNNLSNLAAGAYSVKYTDSITTGLIPLDKGNVFAKDWLIATPNPFKNDVTVYIKAPESGDISLQLTDVKGSVVDVINVQVIQNQTSAIRFNNVQKLQRGVYFLQYISKTQKRTVPLIKG